MAAPVAVRWRHREAPTRTWRRPSPYGGVIGRRRDGDAGGAGGGRRGGAGARAGAERVLVVLFDVPRERFEAGLSPSVRQRLLYRDGFTDPLGWNGPNPDLRAEDFGGLLGGGLPPGGPLMLVLDSLSWLLLRLPPPRLCQALGALLRGPPNSGRELRPPARRLPALPGGAPHPHPGVPRGFGGPGPPPPPHLPPAAVGGRAGGAGGRAAPVPAQPPEEVDPPSDARDHRLHPGAPRGRGPRGPRRRPGRVTPPRVIVGPT
ncbi:elongator complex protein 5 isoform X3 [Calonectris borealis]|uniref:elongator complex protein 5 isoform X3 n=1 Tax=Calonectris borealis TaxID=1323832 RepID=UPI003F4BED4B